MRLVIWDAIAPIRYDVIVMDIVVIYSSYSIPVVVMSASPYKYLLTERRGDWYYARDYCYFRGYHMVDIYSEAEQQFIHLLAQQYARKFIKVRCNCN